MWVARLRGIQVEFVQVEPDDTESIINEVSETCTIPCLTSADNKFTLSQSHSILRYLCLHRDGENTGNYDMYPADFEVRSKIDQWLDWKHLNLRTSSIRLHRLSVVSKVQTRPGGHRCFQQCK